MDDNDYGSAREQTRSQEDHCFGKYRGLVVDNEDPTSMGRLKVTAQGIFSDISVWAMPCVPYAGDGVGFFTLPPVGSGVWVEFEAGDLSHPIWTGCFWGDGQIPGGDAVPAIKFLRTDKVTIRIDDEIGELLIEVDGGSTIRITANEIEQESAKILDRSSGKKTELTAAKFDVNGGALTVV